MPRAPTRRAPDASVKTAQSSSPVASTSTPPLRVDGGAQDAAHAAEDVSVDRPRVLDQPRRSLDVEIRNVTVPVGSELTRWSLGCPRPGAPRDEDRGGTSSTLSDIATASPARIGSDDPSRDVRRQDARNVA